MSNAKSPKVMITADEARRVQSLIDLALRAHGLQIADQVMPLHESLRQQLDKLTPPTEPPAAA